MAKLSLTSAELAALDALIAELKGDSKTVEAEVTSSASFIGAIAKVAVQVTKVTVKATPVAVQVATAVLGKDSKDATSQALANHAAEGLSLDNLIELRKKFN